MTRTSPTARLTDARDAMAAPDLPRALAALLDAWRATPAAALADAIDRVGARAVQIAGITPPTGTTAKARNAAWDALAIAGDPVVRHVLLASLTDTKGNAETLARIELLVAHPPDPRVAAKICDLIAVPIYNVTVSRTRPFWRRVFALLPELADPRIAERARGFDAGWAVNRELNPPERPELVKQLAKMQPALDAAYAGGVPALSAGDAALCEAIVAAIPAERIASPTSARTEAELLAAIYAAPEDDDPRLVYGDWLSERGDPRGEMIVLQIAKARGKLSREQAARERDLVAGHGAAWLAPLPILKTGARFERGFVVACQTHALLDDHPAWATVREVNSVPASDRCHSASLRSLVDLESPHIIQLARLTVPLAVDKLAWKPQVFDHGAWRNAERAMEAWAQISVLPKLSRLAILGHSSWASDWSRMTPELLAWAWRATNFPALADLTFVAHPGDLARWFAATEPTPLRRIELRSDGWDQDAHAWRLIAQRERTGAGNAWSRLDVIAPKSTTASTLSHVGPDAVCAGVASLPPTLAIARIAIPPSSWDDYAPAVDRLTAALATHRRAKVTVYKAAS